MSKDRFFAMDLETTKWSDKKSDLTPLKMVFGILTEFNVDDFTILKERLFKTTDLMELLESLTDSHAQNRAFIYIHNLDFDFLFLLKPFLSLPEKYRIHPIVVGSRIIKVSIMKKYKAKNETQYRTLVEFRNTYCLVSKSLKKIGQELGLEKLENDFETIDEGIYTEKDIEYCKRDNQVVVKLLETWSNTMKTIGLDLPFESITLTAASSAFKLFKQHWVDIRLNEKGKPVKYCPWILESNKMNEYFRDFYFGGRTECFDFNLAREVSYYDINSLYPSVMVNLEFQKPPYMKMDGYYESGFAYEALVDERNEIIPILPERFEGKVCFTAKRKYSLIFKEELEYLKSEGIHVEIIATWLSKQEWQKPFEYIADLYKLRKDFEKNGQKGLANSVKIIMNSTYGRFALITERETLKIEEFQKEHVQEYSDIFADLGVIKKEESIFAEINVLLAAKITALARLCITKKARELVKKGQKIYYMDTDSLVVSKNSIEESKELGGFKIEHDFEWFQAIGPKDYSGKTMEEKEIYKTKGSRIADIDEYLQYHSQGLMNIRPSKLKEMLNLAKQGKIREIEPVQRNVLKKYMSIFDKRVINDDLTTRPIKENEKIEDIKLENGMKFITIFENLKKVVEDENQQ